MGVVWTRGSRSLGILLDPPSLSDAARTIIADDDEQQGIQEAVRGLSVDPWRRGVNLTTPEQSEFQKWEGRANWYWSRHVFYRDCPSKQKVGIALGIFGQGFPDNHPRTVPRVRWGRNIAQIAFQERLSWPGE